MNKVAVLIPSYNEELTIEKVVSDFKHELPDASIYVCDISSSDNTALIAERAGAIVKKENEYGKRNILQRTIYDVDADIYVLVDGKENYSAKDANKLINDINEGYDMSIGERKIF